MATSPMVIKSGGPNSGELTTRSCAARMWVLLGLLRMAEIVNGGRGFEIDYRDIFPLSMPG